VIGGAIIICVCSPEREQGRILAAVKCWDIIADKQPLAYRLYLKYGSRRPTIWLVAAEREDAAHFIVHAHDMPTSFLELQTAIHRQLQPRMEVLGNRR
jgi:hypothetical protein